MNKLWLLPLVILASCKSDPSINEMPGFIWPPGMENCKAFHMGGSDGDYINVAQCPGTEVSTITYRSGKTTSSVIIAGVEYVPVKPPEPPASAVINGIEYIRKP